MNVSPIDIDISPISFTIGSICGSVVGSLFDLSLLRKDPKHYALGIPSGMLVGMYGGGVLGLVTNTLIHDYGVFGGIICGCIGGICGAMAPKQVP